MLSAQKKKWPGLSANRSSNNWARFESLKSLSVLILFVRKLSEKTQVKFNPGLSANRPSNNWALHCCVRSNTVKPRFTDTLLIRAPFMPPSVSVLTGFDCIRICMVDKKDCFCSIRMCGLRKHPFLLALRRWGRFARRNVVSLRETSQRRRARTPPKRLFSQASECERI